MIRAENVSLFSSAALGRPGPAWWAQGALALMVAALGCSRSQEDRLRNTGHGQNREWE